LHLVPYDETVSRDTRATVGGVGVLDKAVAIVDALATSGPLGLSELTAAVGLPRATVYRLAVALEGHRLLARDGSGRFVLGVRLVELGHRAAHHRPDLIEVAGPVLAALRDRTGESAQLYVARGDQRVCVASSESPHSLRTIVPVGATLSMERGSAARCLKLEPDTMALGWTESVEERDAGVASVSAPVIVVGQVVAAVSVSGPIERTSRRPGDRYSDAVMEAARVIGDALS
jgi:DNA-binding IclR family transcriptional regulator